MKEISVAQLRQNPTAALTDVQAGETYVVTKHRHVVAKLVPADAGVGPLRIAPRKDSGPSDLASRPRADLQSYEETQSVLEELSSEW